ncbi:hypothetical protein K1I43_00100 [Anoxybacillus sp. ST70]|uniref:hypothetical protein n=1 Tax=Anoxybacillus sp. ST70 TaxID=2864180 RepID=UPI001C6F86EC|nr:hypothetical protein [Anoxybacillus sp. ST70]MBW9216922.1 hypothetical protein [Anoxybacillus sp. ST70]
MFEVRCFLSRLSSIALRVRAEGKFLRHYFPIIDSCCFRLSFDPNKQIMTQEK